MATFAMSSVSIQPRWSAIFLIILAIHPVLAQPAAPPAALSEWPVASSPARFVIDPDIGGAPTTRLSQVKFYLPNLNWLNQPIRVFTDTGTAVGSDLLWSASGEPATLLFDSSSGARHYKI